MDSEFSNNRQNKKSRVLPSEENMLEMDHNENEIGLHLVS